MWRYACGRSTASVDQTVVAVGSQDRCEVIRAEAEYRKVERP